MVFEEPLMDSLRKCLLFWLVCLALPAISQETREGRLLRFPDVYKDKVAFVYGGDIWVASTSGGVARRLTASPGRELFPKFSPDGNWIAFTGQYDGNFNVYVMPAEGGQPKQLTFYQGSAQALTDRMGIHNEVVTWFPDSKRILFLTRRDATNGWIKRPYSVSIDGGLPEPLPIDQGGLTSFSPDGTKIAYNRIFRNFRTWKRYTGGLAQDIYIYDIRQNVFEQQIPHTDYSDTFPMWHGNTIYFSSDRGPEHKLNLYSYDLGSKQIEQLTKFSDFDLMWPSLGPDAIVFENAGYLYRFDLASKEAKKLTIAVPGETGETMKHWASVARLITDFDIAPDGKRAVFAARGDVFTVPAKEGSARNLTRTQGIREKAVAWSPDGHWIAYISDRTGEDELFITPQDGQGKEQQITSGYKGFKLPPVWSLDSKKLAWADKDLRLWCTDLGDKKPVEVDRAKYGEITNYSWSPDSKWLAYDKPDENGNSFVLLYSLANKKITPVTTSFTHSNSPIFDPAGKYLYFISNRDFNEVVGSYDFEFSNPKTARVYVATLRADEPSPFPALSDEVAIKKDELAATPGEDGRKSEEKGKADKAKEQGKEDEQPKPAAKDAAQDFKIDLEGIQNRIVALPMPPSALGALGAAKDLVIYSTTPIQGLSGPVPGEAPAIHAFDLKDRKDKILIENVDQFALSSDGSKLLYSSGTGPGAHTYGIIDTKADAPKKVGDGVLNLAGLRMEVDPTQEWKQMFNEVWRQERDYFFEAAMNGVDWEKERDKYAPLLPYAASRYDLTYLMGEMIGDLSNSHTYVGGGDYPELHPVNVGLLGADYEVDNATGVYRFKKIFSGENWDAQARSPLTEPGVKVKQGDYLIAVNGRALRAPQTPFELLTNAAGETVTLTINSKPTEEGSHTLQVRPIADELSLREQDWVESNRKKVDSATNGRVGYVYIPDMGGPGLNEFVKEWFPQIRKQGMIIDVRYNGGGFVDQLIFARLRRILVGMGAARNWEAGTVPPVVFHGSMACITNQYAASDGDIFSYFFKVYKLGPLIGERTWGGVRGIRGQIPLLDGGYITRPEFSRYDLNSKWVVENKGVAPDIEVDNRPDLVVKGQDPQLERAIQEVMKDIQANPKTLPPRPPDLPAYPEGPGL
jgi:tricorn protease